MIDEERSSMGLMDILKASAGTLLAIVHTRIELASTELEEERERLEQMLLYVVACIFCTCIGILLLTLLAVVYYWDTPARLYVLAGIVAAYFVAALGFGLSFRHKIKTKPRLFSATLAELRKDRSSLNGNGNNFN